MVIYREPSFLGQTNPTRAVEAFLGTLAPVTLIGIRKELRSKVLETIKAHAKNEADKTIAGATFLHMLKQLHDKKEFEILQPDWGSW